MAVKGISIGLLFAFILVGCGGSGDGGGNAENGKSTEAPVQTDESEASTGYFVDSPVKGLAYRTESQEGLSGPLGQFSYLPGETITFSIGATELGSSEAVGFMMPGNLDEDAGWDGTRAINIARLLITLDADQNPRNGIVIDEKAHEAFGDLGFDLSRPASEFGESRVLLEALANVGRVGLVSELYARNHLISTYSQLPEEVSEADIVALIDTGPNYAGRQSPMTPTPDNLRKAAKVFWADPATPAPNLHWMFEWVNPNLLLDIAERRLQGLAQAPGIRVVGGVEGNEDVVTNASLIVTFDGFELNGWQYHGSIGADIVQSNSDSGQASASAGVVIELGPDVDTTDLIPEKPDFYEYRLFFYDLRVTGSEGYFGLHGWQNVVHSGVNDYLVKRLWTMDTTLREVNSERFVRIVADLPVEYTEVSSDVEETVRVESLLSGSVYVTDWELGAYRMAGVFYSNGPEGINDFASVEFYNDDVTLVGQLNSIALPDYADLEQRVRAEVVSEQDGSVTNVGVFKNETPLLGEPVDDALPLWINAPLEYLIVKDGLDGAQPVRVDLYSPPMAMDPDGDPVMNLELAWIVGGQEMPVEVADGVVSLPIRLDLPLEYRSENTAVCFRNRTTFSDVTLVRTFGIDLSKEANSIHSVPVEDSPCESL
ncbi:hypothetical protein QQF73_16370 [Marinobacter sp. M216]|uniref:Uncharacterized protein n=1 Tax=Marinobacter albus TaxID=3030833 RepID=A0ABT7HFQ6_9GAMM|nr:MULTISPECIES: hypothetical protein [unclassified Marinobacter]MBW7472658.1 hypothetical protein [Marinobacter sp. F4218]MDK9559211.1 hypothetical protein [Marinobacter sp. M216]